LERVGLKIHLNTTQKCPCQEKLTIYESIGNVLIKKDFHDAIPRRPSREAANIKQAFILSMFNSGKSKLISSFDMPFASQFKTSETEILVPITIGFPNLFSELISMYFFKSTDSKIVNSLIITYYRFGTRRNSFY